MLPLTLSHGEPLFRVNDVITWIDANIRLFYVMIMFCFMTVDFFLYVALFMLVDILDRYHWDLSRPLRLLTSLQGVCCTLLSRPYSV